MPSADRQVVATTLLRQVRRREVDRDPAVGEREAGVDERGLHAIAALTHGRLGQATILTAAARDRSTPRPHQRRLEPELGAREDGGEAHGGRLQVAVRPADALSCAAFLERGRGGGRVLPAVRRVRRRTPACTSNSWRVRGRAGQARQARLQDGAGSCARVVAHGGKAGRQRLGQAAGRGSSRVSGRGSWYLPSVAKLRRPLRGGQGSPRNHASLRVGWAKVHRAR